MIYIHRRPLIWRTLWPARSCFPAAVLRSVADMYHGGTNFGHTAGQGISTSYDYNAPLTEFGFAREPKYGVLKRLHAVLHTFEAVIVGTEPAAQWWSQGVAGMPGLSLYNYTNKVAFLVNSNRTVDFTVRYNCTASAVRVAAPAPAPDDDDIPVPTASSLSLEVTVPHWSVTIVDGDACSAVFSTATEPDARPPPPPAEAGPAGSPSSDWSFWVEPTDLAWCRDAGRLRTLAKLPEHIDFTGGPLVTDYLLAEAELPAGPLPAGTALTAMPSPAVGGPLGGVARVDGFVDGRGFSVTPGWPVSLPTGSSGGPLHLRMSIQGLPNYLWSNKLCKNGGCNGDWDSHLENYDQGLLGQILLNSTSSTASAGSSGMVVTNLTDAGWRVCAGLHGEALNLSSPVAADPPGGWQAGTRPLSATGTWVRLQLPLPTLAAANTSVGVGLNLTGMAEGEAWVNGHSLGRYTLHVLPSEPACTVCNRTGPYDPNGECHFRCNKLAEPLYHAPRGWLNHHSVNNTVVLWERESGADPSKVSFASVVG